MPVCRVVRRFILLMLCAWGGMLHAAADGGDGGLWLDGGRPTEQARHAVAVLQDAAADGLDPADYAAAALAQALAAAEGDAADAEAFDAALTTAMRRYLSDLHFGRLDPRTLHASVGVRRSAGFDPAAVLREALGAYRLPGALAAAMPAQPFYASLRGALARYRELAGDPLRGGLWDAPLPLLPRRKLEPGQAWDGVPALLRRLVTLGDLPATTALPLRYEGALVEGLRAFQLRHGLEPDGVIGKETLARLGVSPAARVRQIGLNLERLRWMPLRPARRMIVVNVPEFALRGYALQAGTVEEALRMKVIVGKALDTRTPLIVEDMRFIEFSPYWNVPPSIARAELVPRLQREPAYFGEQGFEFVGDAGRVLATLSADSLEAVLHGQLRIRQRPGPKNALGDIKFVFPNNASIYLHHTPAPQLFARVRRDFSHGCIRVEAPVELAKFVLQDQPDWNEARIREAMGKGRSATLRLREPLPVVIAYSTVRAGDDGRIFFFPDIYGHDAALEEALGRRAEDGAREGGAGGGRGRKP